MPVYRVGQYHLQICYYDVEAKNDVEAIRHVLHSDLEPDEEEELGFGNERGIKPEDLTPEGYALLDTPNGQEILSRNKRFIPGIAYIEKKSS